MLSLHQLTCFLSVYEHGSLTRAAEELGYAQPSVSEQVRARQRAVLVDAEEAGQLVQRKHRTLLEKALESQATPMPTGRSHLRSSRNLTTSEKT